MVHKVIFPLDLQLAWFSCWNPSLTFMSGVGHCTAWEEVPMWGKASKKQQVTEPFWYHCKLFEFVRNEANLTTTPLEPLWRGA